MSELISPTSLKDLVDAHANRHATVIADQAAFKINVQYGMADGTNQLIDSEDWAVIRATKQRQRDNL